ncbi:MAG: hypothetical protein KAI43_13625 [Candidatus Aureabacteria bacterium]|nr:hypothetical protein [Candidatus Paceibacterota bacterium]MCK5708682.1 hypothetical protein [Candidatus Auribacterota bacterium]
MTKKDKRNISITVVLVFVLIYFIFNAMSTIKKQKPVSTPAESPEGGKTSEEIVKDAQKVVSATTTVDDSAIPLSTRSSKATLKKEAMEEQKRIAKAGWGQDPFFHKISEDNIEHIDETHVLQPDSDIDSLFKLTNITRTANGYTAEINRQKFIEGNTISSGARSYKVKKILMDSVILEKDGIEYDLRKALFSLSGISRIGSTFIAVIDRKMLRVGDTLSDGKRTYKIKTIEKDKVILESNGGTYEIKMEK